MKMYSKCINVRMCVCLCVKQAQENICSLKWKTKHYELSKYRFIAYIFRSHYYNSMWVHTLRNFKCVSNFLKGHKSHMSKKGTEAYSNGTNFWGYIWQFHYIRSLKAYYRKFCITWINTYSNVKFVSLPVINWKPYEKRHNLSSEIHICLMVIYFVLLSLSLPS